MMQLHGHVAPGFERVADAFRTNFDDPGEVGAACCVYVGGRSVVDVSAGFADREAARPWLGDTAALVFSATKGVTAICAHRLAEDGRLDLDAPVARYWPEFGAEGKERIPVRWLLCHQAGLPTIDADVTLDDVLAWDPIVRALAAQRPQWEPASRHGYHFRTYGWLVGEVVRRVTGTTLGRYFADAIARPLGLQFWIGLPEAEEPRVARLYPPPPLPEAFLAQDTLLGRAATGPSDLFRYDERWNARPLHAAEMPSSNGIGTARALARLYAATIGEVDGLRLLRPDTVAAARRVQAEGDDAVLPFPTRFGTGFMLPPTLGPRARPGAFGHPGAGGSLGMADPEAGFALGYVMNRMQLGLTIDERADRLVAATYAALAGGR